MPVTLVLGGARSGKSRWAQGQAETHVAASGGRLVILATGHASDKEMAERIARHQADRDERWRTVEAPVQLAQAIAGCASDEVVVADCLTLWLSNLMLGEADLQAAFTELEDTVRQTRARLWLVSNEVGQGIVPDNALARRFRDEAGRLHQRLAAASDEVVMIVAGLPLWLKRS